MRLFLYLRNSKQDHLQDVDSNKNRLRNIKTKTLKFIKTTTNMQ
ncbi:hypothetical protein SAMN05444338_106166 [Flavobacterium degerlachei]|uniref:Uncharacterized protein n=1 Tax=Flavobacterium degerlachei TaxID=229203 RepID=A0A1H2YCW1_9FLAO|nr:hypothetical protein SAMN05444338_106166 [Flavobacterium degerlachei]